MPNRVVITGVGIVSSIGNTYTDVTDSLMQGRSGTVFMPDWAQYNVHSQVAGIVSVDDSRIQQAGIQKKLLRAMPKSVVYGGLAAHDAVADSGWSSDELSDTRTACLVGSGVADVGAIHQGALKYYSGNIRRNEPYAVLKSMSSSASALLTKQLGIQGRSYSISSACATGTHNIGHAYELIRGGIIDRAISGGCEEVSELIAGSFETLRMALSTGFNDRGHCASRPYDKDRDGFVISGGAGIVTLESHDAAIARGAHIYAEIIGYDANSDPFDLVLPRPEGGTFVKCIEGALASADLSPAQIDAINTHGTGTVAGDIAEVNGLREAFGANLPMYSSTKSMTGHAIGAAGSIELIACLSMLEHGYVAPSINIDTLDPSFDDTPVVRETTKSSLNTMLTLNFGFGGTNAAMIIAKA